MMVVINLIFALYTLRITGLSETPYSFFTKGHYSNASYICAPNDTNVKHINLMQKIKYNTIMITCN